MQLDKWVSVVRSVPGLSGIRYHCLSALLLLMVVCNEAGTEQLSIDIVSISGGTFRMGDLNGEGHDHKLPVREVTVTPFKLGKYEVTFAQWDACLADGGCDGYSPDDEGWGRGNRPVIHVSWDDAQTFISWLNAKTGDGYRLPTEAEWEYAARAGSSTKYSWGDDIGENRDNCDGCDSVWDVFRTLPVGSFSANAWGLHDVHSNVYEWVQDCWNDNYEGAPSDSRSWESGDCNRGVLRSGTWSFIMGPASSSSRTSSYRTDRAEFLGFRLAQDL